VPSADHEDIILTLRPLADSVPVAHRLRALLKTALRRDRFRCVSIAGPPAHQAEAPSPDNREGGRG
jgi:hypothetical protein